MPTPTKSATEKFKVVSTALHPDDHALLVVKQGDLTMSECLREIILKELYEQKPVATESE